MVIKGDGVLKRTYLKSVLRSITGTIARFIAILVIVALGVGFLVGLMSSTPDMQYSVDRYYDENRMYDFRILSTLGLTADDVSVLRDTEGVQGVMPAVSEHVLFRSPEGDTLVGAVTGLDYTVLEGTGEDALNRTVLLEGRYPQQRGECLLLRSGVSLGLQVGDILTLSEENSDIMLREDSYRIVGIADTPYNFSIESETSSIGGGKVQITLYLGDDCFDADCYTDIFMTVDGASELNSFSDAYWELIQDKTFLIQEIGRERVTVRFEQLATQMREELEEQRRLAEEEFQKQEALLEDGRVQLEEERAALARAKEQLDANAALITALTEAVENGQLPEGSFSALIREYDEGVAAYTDGLEQLAAAEKELTEGEAALAASREEAQEKFEAAEEELVRQEIQLEDAKIQLEDSKLLLAQLKTQLDDNARLIEILEQLKEAFSRNDLASAWKVLEQLKEILGENSELVHLLESALTLGQALPERLEGILDLYYALQLQYEEGMTQVADTERQIAQGEAALQEGKMQLEEQRQAAETAFSQSEQELAAGREELTQNRTLLEETGVVLSENAESIEQLRPITEAGMDSAEDVRQTIDNYQQGQTEYDRGLVMLSESEAELENGRIRLEEAKRDAESEFTAAEKSFSDPSEHRWYVLDRNANVGYVSFESNSEKVDAICKVFPVFFFLIAVLVTLTTMTRMVDEERIQIGTLKALGYSDGRIMFKYLLYAAAASVIGCGIGLAVGIRLFPSVIWNAYSILYYQPEFYCRFLPEYAIGFSVALVAATLLATWLACRSTLSEVAAGLMQPKAPKIGKRIFLERIGFVWKHLSFTKKVTARNLFRYKKRLYMTVIGIMGCTALLVAGFGLRDSINYIIFGQFGEIMKYNVTVQTRHDNETNPHNDLFAILDNPEQIQDYLLVHQQMGTAVESDTDVYLVVPREMDRMEDFISLRTRVGKHSLMLEADGVIVSEKFASVAGLKVGSRFTLDDGNGTEAVVRITGITENYLNNYVYMTPDFYEKAFGQAPEYTTLFVKAAGGLEQQEQLSELFLKNEEVSSVTLTDWTKESFSNMIRSIDYIVLVLIVAAAALAVVVLYNLTNINIAERQKEIATIKVLGFYDREVGSYIFREISLLTLFGTLFGLVCGIALHGFVVQTVEMESVMFGRSISWLSFVYSAALTLLFSAIVDLFMYRKLKKISMVESLKAVD